MSEARLVHLMAHGRQTRQRPPHQHRLPRVALEFRPREPTERRADPRSRQPRQRHPLHVSHLQYARGTGLQPRQAREAARLPRALPLAARQAGRAHPGRRPHRPRIARANDGHALRRLGRALRQLLDDQRARRAPAALHGGDARSTWCSATRRTSTGSRAPPSTCCSSTGSSTMATPAGCGGTSAGTTAP